MPEVSSLFLLIFEEARLSREVTIASERIYEGRLIGLRVDTVRLSGGRVARQEVVDSVAIVALDEAKNLPSVRQYRKPTEKELFEIPAGTLEEEPESCARRELREETGYVAWSDYVASILPLGIVKNISRSSWLKIWSPPEEAGKRRRGLKHLVFPAPRPWR